MNLFCPQFSTHCKGFGLAAGMAIAILIAIGATFVSKPLPVLAQDPCDYSVAAGSDAIAQHCNSTANDLLEANSEIDNEIQTMEALAMNLGLTRLGQVDVVSQANPSATITYVVQPGDWLSRIAARYETTMSAILALNPQITNADYIRVGQELTIPVGDSFPADDTTGDSSTEPSVTIVPTFGEPGTTVQVTANNLPANTTIEIGTGPVESEYNIIAVGQSNAEGELSRVVTIPERVNPGERWVIALTPKDSPADYISNPFTATEATMDDESPNRFTRTTIYLVALEDEGRTGMQIGCGDRLVPVEVQIEPTLAVLRAAMESLVNLDDRFYEESGLYNALYRSNLSVDELTLENGTATIQLSGQLSLGGVCDTPRFKGQLQQTALQFYTVDNVEIFINGEALDSAVQ